MSAINLEIKEVISKQDLNKFIKFPFQLYQNDPYWVPPLIQDELKTFDKSKNPAFDYCQTKLWLAYREGEIVGRIAGIIHEIEAEQKKIGRFGWIDFIDDHLVSKQLIQTVEDWLKFNGLQGMHGPLGFTDMDFEGILTEGFDSIATIATIYNFPYYKDHLEMLGYQSVVDWVEMEGDVPDSIPEKYSRTTKLVSDRFKFEIVRVKSSKQLLKYGKSMFEALNLAFQNLYGFHALTEREIVYYIDQYFSFINKDYVSLILDADGEVAGFGITTPSMSLAFQKAKGKLFPFGFIHILKALKSNDTAEMFLVGVRPKYQKFGVTNLIFYDILQGLINAGIKKFYSNPIITTNSEAIDQWNWKDLKSSTKIRKKRSCYRRNF